MNLKTSDKQTNSNTNSTAIFKQFESSNTKDISLVNITPKENIHVKQDVSKPSSVISENIVKELNVELLSSESAQSEGSMSDLMQNQSPQEQVTRVMIQGDIKYETVETKTAEATAQLKTAVSTPSKIVEQISKQLEGMINNSKLNMVLNPGTLGKVNLQLINTKEGLMAQFTVTTQDAKDLLLKGLDGLKESLLAQGVSVDSLSIKLEETDSENQFDWTEQEGSNGGNKQQQARKQKENEKDFEQMMFDIENENNV
jgi:flagellar hook-length control protein FliK